MKLEYIVDKKHINKTIKDICLSYFKISHRLLITLKKNECFYINDKKAYVYNKVNQNDKVTIDLNYEEESENIVPNKNIPLDIIYEDEWLLVLNKNASIPIHPSINHFEDSLSNGIKYYFDSINLKKKIRIVNRLDKDTSGLVIVAKCEYVQEELIKQMKENIFSKEYIAIVEGFLNNKEGTINKPIARKKDSIIERCIDENGDISITKYNVIKELEINNKKDRKNYKVSIVNCKLLTGRTHQIRVHFSSIGHPLLGDDLYGGNKDLFSRQALHSYKISFIHPITNKKEEFISNLPKEFNI